MKMSRVTVDLNDINKVINALEILKDDLEKLPNKVSNEIAETGLKYLNKQYSNLYSDPNITNISTQVKKTSKGYSIFAYGKDVVYAEFGTGDKGQESPHPERKTQHRHKLKKKRGAVLK